MHNTLEFQARHENVYFRTRRGNYWYEIGHAARALPTFYQQ